VEKVKKRELPVVYCEYSQTDNELKQILEESFRIYLTRMLATANSNVLLSKR